MLSSRPLRFSESPKLLGLALIVLTGTAAFLVGYVLNPGSSGLQNNPRFIWDTSVDPAKGPVPYPAIGPTAKPVKGSQPASPKETVYPGKTETLPSGARPTPPVGTQITSISGFPLISQRDKSQYNSEAEWKEWSPSACSAASLVAVLNGFGVPTRITDILWLMQQERAINASKGLFDYGVLSSIPSKFGLRGEYSEDKDLDRHFESILNGLRLGKPVVINVWDAVYFPGGHFVVATHLNPDNTVSIINPDPVPGSSPAQDWPLEGLKLYFSRTTRSSIISPEN